MENTPSVTINFVFKNAPIRVKGRGIQNGILGVQELRQLLLQGLVNILRPADKTDRTHSKAMALQGCVGRLQHFGVAAEAQVVVGTKIQHFAAIR
jgi:hypothetical protein